jgi:hypothetical protein
MGHEKCGMPVDTGLWILPFGVAAIFDAGMGIGLAQKSGAKHTVTIGMALETFGLMWVAFKIGPQVLWTSSPCGVHASVDRVGSGNQTGRHRWSKGTWPSVHSTRQTPSSQHSGGSRRP